MHAILLLASLAATATGTWDLKSDEMKSEKWTLSPIAGTLVLEERGTELKGTWTGPMKEEPWILTGQIKDGTFDLRSEPREIDVTRDGAKSKVKARWVFRGTVTDDTMTGTMMLDRDSDTGVLPRRPFKATRRR